MATLHEMIFLVISAAALVAAGEMELDSIAEESISRCLDGRQPKSLAGRQANISNHCVSWKQSSCCDQETSLALHGDGRLDSFDYDHCLHRANRRFSERCLAYFTRDLCFHQCEPYLKQWIVPTDLLPSATERFVGVPLCESECDAWWAACRSEWTCVQNWRMDFKWRAKKNVTHSRRVNQCPDDSRCQTFDKIYSGAGEFCEKVWNGSWSVTPDSSPCMKMSFNPDGQNPNRIVAAYYFKTNSGGAMLSRNIINFGLLSGVVFVHILMALVMSKIFN